MPRKKEVLSYTLYIPENLDIDAMLVENPPNFKYERDNFVYIASLPCSIMESYRNRNKEYEIAIDKGYVPIYSRALKQKVDNYKPYIQYLIDNDIWECDGKSSANTGKSLWYRFTPQYNTPIKPITINSSRLIRQFTKRTRPYVEEEQVLSETSLSEVPYLIKWFNPALRIDIEKVKIFLHNLYQSDCEVKGAGAAQRRENSLWMSAQKINNESNNNLSIDSVGKRFYSPLTNLKSELRAYVTYDNKKLVSLDLINSQFFFCLVLFDIEVFDKCKVADILTLYYNRSLQDKEIALHIEKIRSLIEKEGRKILCDEFKEAIYDGLIYEVIGVYIGTYHKYSHVEVTEEDLKRMRKRTKEEVMKIVFGREMKGKVKLDNEGLPVNNNPKIDFNYYFPIIDKIFRLIKEPNYKVLAWVLQYIEAHVLLYTVCPVIAAERPDIPLFTIHDSIVTTEEHAEYVYQRMITIIEETIGFVPKIKPEIWEEGNIELVEEEDTELLEEAFEKEEETKS